MKKEYDKPFKKTLDENFFKNVSAGLTAASEKKSGDPIAMKIASLFYYYDIDQVNNTARKVFSRSISDEELQSLKNKSIEVTLGGTKKYYLKDYERNKVLKTFRHRHEIQTYVQSASSLTNDAAQKLFVSCLEGRAPKIETQNMRELTDSLRISRWLQDTIFEQPDEQEIKMHLRREELLAPLRQLTRNFAGRERELSEMNDYVDHLPKATISESASMICVMC